MTERRTDTGRRLTRSCITSQDKKQCFHLRNIYSNFICDWRNTFNECFRGASVHDALDNLCIILYILLYCTVPTPLGVRRILPERPNRGLTGRNHIVRHRRTPAVASRRLLPSPPPPSPTPTRSSAPLVSAAGRPATRPGRAALSPGNRWKHHAACGKRCRRALSSTSSHRRDDSLQLASVVAAAAAATGAPPSVQSALIVTCRIAGHSSSVFYR